MEETIEVSKCCLADTEDIVDELGDFLLLKCSRCGQECQTTSVCAFCKGSGRSEGQVCLCSVETDAEMRGEALSESLKGN